MSSIKKYFGTDGIRGKVGVAPITPEFALKLGWAVGQILAKDGCGYVTLGKDTRLSGYMLESALEAGLVASGVGVYRLGVMPTPGIAYLTRHLKAKAGIVISASHNGFEDNGIKFFGPQGFKLPDSTEWLIEDQLEHPLKTVGSAQIGRILHIADATTQYRAFCQNSFPQDLTLNGLKVVIDCANGAMYHIAPQVLIALGATVEVLANQPDGYNINHQCGSVAPQQLQQRVLAVNADLGIAFDGDGDRVILVDEYGEVVDGDEILFILACAYAKRGLLKGGVVGTLMSNLGLEHALLKKGFAFQRAQVGDRYVLDSLKMLGWNLGGEASGHIVCLDQTTTGDGMIAALQVLVELKYSQQSLHTLKQQMHKLSQILINVPALQGMEVIATPKVKAALKQAEQSLNHKGRILLRPSGTEPLIRIMVEGEEQSQVQKVAQYMAKIVTQVAKQPIN
jgi:phosphoglucosamine mutase